MAELEVEILRKTEIQLHLWCRYIDDIVFLWEHGEEKMESFIDNMKTMHPTKKSTADWYKISINFLHVVISIETDLYVKLIYNH